MWSATMRCGLTSRLPDDAHPAGRAMLGHELRLVDVVDVNSPDEVGPPELYAWLRCDPIPERDDLAKALLAYFTGQLGISTTMRPHRGMRHSAGARHAVDGVDVDIGQLPRARGMGWLAALQP